MLTAIRHQPVLADRCVELLRPRPGGVYLDATLGLGGHAELLLRASAPDGRVIGVDRDPAALALARERLEAFSAGGYRPADASEAGTGRGLALEAPERFEPAGGGRLTVVAASFADLAIVAASLGLRQVDGVLYDLGVSSLQLDEPARGFSYRADAPLDMRMDPTRGITAAEVVNTYPRQRLARILREYGEERFAARIARFIDEARQRAPIETTGELVNVIKAAIPAAARRSGPHPARRTFQALRIEVNGELDALRASLPQAIDLLAPGGRIVVLSYHSLEDRIVKHAFSDAAATSVHPADLPEHVIPQQPKLRILTRRPVTPSPAEIETNPRAESAKLRAAEKLAGASAPAHGGEAE
jgi:16S rRNA (cytosine1402-N4)-methyltransferase